MSKVCQVLWSTNLFGQRNWRTYNMKSTFSIEIVRIFQMTENKHNIKYLEGSRIAEYFKESSITRLF